MPRKPSGESGHPKALRIESPEQPSTNEMPQRESTPSPKDKPSSSQSESRNATGKTKKPRKSPLEAVITAAERQLARMTRRKARAVNRIGRIEAHLEKARASIGQYDAMLQRLKANIDALKAAV